MTTEQKIKLLDTKLAELEQLSQNCVRDHVQVPYFIMMEASRVLRKIIKLKRGAK